MAGEFSENALFIWTAVDDFFNSPSKLSVLLKYLSVEGMKKLRSYNRTCNNEVINNQRFIKDAYARVDKNWHQNSRNYNVEIGVKASEMAIKRFAYHKNLMIWTRYIDRMSLTLRKLTIGQCSMNWAGLSSILKTFQNLNSLTLHEMLLKGPKFPPPNPEAIKCSIRNLTLDRLREVNDFTSVQLFKSINQLESLVIKNLFTKDKSTLKESRQPSPSLVIPFDPIVFLNRLPILIGRNVATLKTFHLEESIPSNLNLILRILQRMQEIKLNLIEFGIIFAPDVFDLNVLRNFINESCEELKTFRVNFLGIPSNEKINQILGFLAGKPLSHLHLGFNGNEANPPPASIDISQALLKLSNLKSIFLMDHNVIAKKDFIAYKKLAKPIEFISQVLIDRDQAVFLKLAEKDRIFGTKVNLNFGANILPGLREIRLDGIIPTGANDMMTQLFTPMREIQIDLLTKLELIGSAKMYTGNSRALLEFISKLINLESLTLSKMQINEEDLTGVSKAICKRMRKGRVFKMGVPQTDRDFMGWFEFSYGHLYHRRETYFDKLLRLRSLDLSGNTKISDFALFTVIRKVPQIQTLDISDCDKVTDIGLKFIKIFLRGLFELNLRNVREITEYGINKIVEGCPDLKRIYTTRITRHRPFLHQLLVGQGYKLSPDYDSKVKAPWGEFDGEDD